MNLILDEKKRPFSSINELFYPLLFSSLNFNILVESKTNIRKLFDRFIFGVSPLYTHYILRYNRALKQKLCLLRDRINILELTSWNKIIAEMGYKIVKARVDFISQLNKALQNKFGKNIKVTYRHAPDEKYLSSENSFLLRLQQVSGAEVKLKRTLFGPHLDSYEIEVMEKKINLFSSGEKRTHLMALYMAYIDLYISTNNENPVFLIDDHDAAVDGKNLNFINEHFPKIQIIATSVNFNTRFDHFMELRKEI